MQGTTQALTEVPGVLLKTLSPDKTQRVQAEEYLARLFNQPGYAILLFQIIEMHASGPAEPDISIRQAAAVSFKNLVKKRWQPDDDSNIKEPPLTPEDKGMVKQSILHLMCNVPDDVQKQLSEALTIISAHDFPEQWPQLLPDMVSKLSSQDYHIINGVLRSANAIFKRFRYALKSDHLYGQLLFCLNNFAQPLTELFKFTCGQLDAAAAANDAARLHQLLEALRVVSRVFYSLNWQDLPEYFEDHMGEWFPAYHGLLGFHHRLLVDDSEDDRPGPLEQLRAAIVENVTLYATKYEEEFQPYLPQFATAVWELLKASGTSATQPKYDSLITTSMRFLTSLVQKQLHFGLFNNPSLLRQIVEAIVVPNVTMRQDDEELFEDNATEYIQRDMEGSDQETRRRCSCDLIRGMCQQFDDQVTTICLEYITNMLNLYQAKPSNWKSKDAALQLFLAVTVRAESAAKGASIINERVNVLEFFNLHVLSELESSNATAHPIIRADCLRFVSTFRQQFSSEALRALMPMLVTHLGSNQAVVQTYAASCIERLLNVRDKSPTNQLVRRVDRATIQPVLQGLFEGLFSVVDRSEGGENEYVMKAIMRLLTVVQEDITPVTGIVLDKLTACLGRVWKNPSNPLFNHYLFESIAALVRFVCQANPNATADFEERLFPPFEGVLSMDVAEFMPYVFQILAQLLLYRPNGMSPAFARLFPPLLTAQLWERRANVPGLVLLLQSYLHKGTDTLAQHVEPILGIFSTLLNSRFTEKYGFDLLMSAYDNLPLAALNKYQRRIFEMILTRLQVSKAPQTTRLVIYFLSFFSGKRGPSELVQTLEEIQQGVTVSLVTNVWLRNVTMPARAGGVEGKAAVIGMTRLLCEYRDLQSNLDLWGALSAGVMAVACPEAETGLSRDDADEEDEWERQQAAQEVSGEAVYSRLHFASPAEQDWFTEVPDAGQFLVRELHGLMTTTGGGAPFVQAMQKALSPQQLQALQSWFEKAGVRLQ